MLLYLLEFYLLNIKQDVVVLLRRTKYMFNKAVADNIAQNRNESYYVFCRFKYALKSVLKFKF